MKLYMVSINANEPSKDDVLTYYGTLADYDIKANSENEVRGEAFMKFCEENPNRSHNIDDYAISVGFSGS